MKLQFIGAIGTVTGSKTLVFLNGEKILVDCGLYQGLKNLRLRNWAPLPYKASEINKVFLTHAHIDHSGYIPLLIKQGFRGKIYCTPGTFELCNILLPDSGYLQEEDAAFANKHHFSKHSPALPLYTREDAEASLSHFSPIDFHTPFELGDGATLEFLPAGHILGASFIRIKQKGVTLVFSGDLGRPHDILMRPPEFIDHADYLLLESTYGDRLHEKNDPKAMLGKVINETIHRGGTVIVPSFAVGRAQALLYLVHQLKQENEIPDIPVYLDSPMATDVTELYCDYASEHRLSETACSLMCREARIVNSPQESHALDLNTMPKVIITASGMATGGRVVHHLKAFVGDEKNTIFFPGFQASGTRGEAMIHGAERIKIHGAYYPVHAQIVVQDSLSAHADYGEILEWLKHFKKPPKAVYLTHGEPLQADALRLRIQEELGWNCILPEYLEEVTLKS